MRLSDLAIWKRGRRQQQRRIEELEVALQRYQHHVQELQTAYADRISSTENPYKTRESQVRETLAKFNGESQWGCELVRRIIKISAAFAVPNGVDVGRAEAVSQNDGKAEIDYIKAWLDAYNVNEGLALTLAKGAKLQGIVAVQIGWKRLNTPEKPGEVMLSYLPWSQYGYTIEPDGGSNLKGPWKLTYRDADETEVILRDDQFAFISFDPSNGFCDADGHVDGRPLVGNILRDLEALSETLVDWRKNVQLFGWAMPYFKTQTKTEASALMGDLRSSGWKIGKVAAGTGDFEYKTPGEVTGAERLITTCLKIISGETGVNPHFLGFPDLLSNRAGAESMGEPTEIVSRSEIDAWTGFYEALFNKVIRMRNTNIQNGQKLREGVAVPVLKPLSDRAIALVKEVYLPMYKEGALTLRGLLDKVPDLDAEAEAREVEKEREKRQAEFAAMPTMSGFAGGKEPADDEQE